MGPYSLTESTSYPEVGLKTSSCKNDAPTLVVLNYIRSRCVLMILMFVLGCGGDRFDSIRNISSEGETIICLGDSLTEGVGAESGEDYPTVLSRELGMRVVNAGQSGDTSAGALARISDSLLDKNPRMVIVLLGGNDFLRQLPTAETRKNLKEIVRRIQDQGAMVAIAGMRLGLFTDEYSPIYAETAQELGALYIPEVMKGISTIRNSRAIKFIPTPPVTV
jgi:acyl-CoA thioesterase I